MNLLHEPSEISAAKVGLLAYMAVEDIPVTRAAIHRLQRQSMQIAQRLAIPAGYVDLALYALLPARGKAEIERLIEAEQQKLEATDRRRLSGSIISTRTDVGNRAAALHRIALLKSELDQALAAPSSII